MHTFSEGLTDWFRHGQRGISSNTIVEVLEGLPVHMLTRGTGWDHPADASDFRRCVRLLDAVPSYRPRLDELRELSPAWAVLVEHWAELEATLRADCPELGPCDWSERTYQRMAFLLHPVAGMRGVESAESLLVAYAEFLSIPLARGRRAHAARLRDMGQRCARAGLMLSTIRHEYERRVTLTRTEP